MDHYKKSILVYTGVKTGSSTIYHSLESLKLGIPIYHIHFLTKREIAEYFNIYRNNFIRIGRIPDALLTSRYLRKKMDKGLDIKEWKVITGIRDPIAQHISWFFYKMDVLLPPEIQYRQKIRYLPPERFAKELIDLFLREIHIGRYSESSHLVSWFEIELKQILDIDVCSLDFPKSKGYKIYRDCSLDILFYKLEALDHCAEEAFKDFLKIKNFTLKKKNTAREKKYASVYDNFLDLLVLPESYIDKMYRSRYVRHFYSDAEINVFKERWQRKNISL